MLSRKERVSRHLFPVLLSQSKSFFSKNFSLRVSRFTSLPDEVCQEFALDGETSSQFAFVVSKKVSKKAYERNLLKRRGYSIIRKVRGDIPSGFGCLFFAKPSARELPFSEMEKEILSLLKCAKIL